MRILVVSNFYPPHYIGGYELRCKDVVDGLRARGHEISVLTSMHGVRGPETEAGVYRRLHRGGVSTLPRGSFLRAVSVEFQDPRVLTSLISQLKPQLISVWNLAGLADSLLPAIQRLGIAAVYDISDDWLINKLQKNLWRRRSSRWSRRVGKVGLRLLLKLLLPHSVLAGPSAFQPRDCYFTSKALKEQYLSWGFPVADARVIYCGIPLDTYMPRKRKDATSATNLLFVGQVEKHKGTHTALQAVAELVKNRGINGARLTIVGGGMDREYGTWLRDMAIDANVDDKVEFLGKVPRETMPKIYNEHDILIFPSIIEEAFSLTLLEAMASGLAVVATTTGGSREVLIDGWNSLTFPAQDSDQLAAQLQRLIENEGLRKYLSANAMKTVQSRFDIRHMVDQIEHVFIEALAESAAEPAL